MNKIKYIKTQDEEGEISENLFISADATNIDLEDGTNVQTKVNNIDSVLEQHDNQITSFTEIIEALQNDLNDLKAFIDNINFNSFEEKVNKVIEITNESTNQQYPTAKCMYDLLGDVETALNTLIGEEVE